MLQNVGISWMPLLPMSRNYFSMTFDIQNKVVNVDLLKYKDVSSMLGRKLALLGKNKNDGSFLSS